MKTPTDSAGNIIEPPTTYLNIARKYFNDEPLRHLFSLASAQAIRAHFYSDENIYDAVILELSNDLIAPEELEEMIKKYSKLEQNLYSPTALTTHAQKKTREI